jgi:hypothetical protein
LRKRDGSRVNDLPFAQFLAEVQATIARRSPVL